MQTKKKKRSVLEDFLQQSFNDSELLDEAALLVDEITSKNQKETEIATQKISDKRSNTVSDTICDTDCDVIDI